VARVFNLPTVLRQVPNRLLRPFFEKQQVPLPGVDWNELRERDVQPILEGLATLSSAKLLAVETELRSVFEMRCDAGIHALGESAAAREITISSNAYHRKTPLTVRRCGSGSTIPSTSPKRGFSSRSIS
jgi:hypothetical protein